MVLTQGLQAPELACANTRAAPVELQKPEPVQSGCRDPQPARFDAARSQTKRLRCPAANGHWATEWLERRRNVRTVHPW